MRIFLALVILLALTGIGGTKKGAILKDQTTRARQAIINSRPTMWLDSDGKVTLTSGLISSWCCSLGSVCFTQGTAANQATRTSVSGKWIPTFDGTDDSMSSTSQLGAIFGASAKSFILVVQANMADADDALAVGADIVQLQFAATGFNFRNNDGVGDNNILAFTANTPAVVAGWHNGTNTTIRVNGGATQSVASGATTALTNTMYLGQYGTSVNWFNGKIYTIIAWNRVVSDQELKNIEKALAQKYSISAYVG